MSYQIEQVAASHNAWFTPAESNAYYKARYAREGITLHWWGDGTGASNHDNIVNYFVQQAAAGIKSVNYVVSDNKITQMVDPDNVAWCSETGNPTTISIECQPTLGDEGYKKLGWLISYLQTRYGHQMSLYGHNHWYPTDCPGTISLARAAQEAAGVDTTGAVTPQPAPVVKNQPATAATTTASTVTLPGSVDSWRWYPLGKTPVPANAGGFLRPASFGGLTYQILDRPMANVVTIQTQDFGKVNIWVGPDTVAQFGGSVTKLATTPTPVGHSSLVLPGSVDRWRVYHPAGPWTVGNEIAFLRPALFGGLSYPILGNPATNIFIIPTADFGQVAIYAGPDTEAQFK